MDGHTKQDEEWIKQGGPQEGREGAQSNVKGPHRQNQEEQQARAEEEEREAEETALVHSRRLGMVLDSVGKILGNVPELHVESELPSPTKEALEALYLAKTGKGENSEYLPGARRNKLFNEALALLRPVLAMEHLAERHGFAEDLEVAREEAAELRHEIYQRIQLEAHRGRVRTEMPVDGAEKSVKAAKLSKMGSLAWELARLGRKKRKPDDHDPDEHPIADALNTLARYAHVLGTIGARLAVIEVKLGKTPASRKTHAILSRHLGSNRLSMVNTLQQFLRSCTSDSGVPGDIGSHPVLREKFANLVKKYGAVTHSDDAIPAAIEVVKLIDSCLDDGGTPMKKADGADGGDKKKKGWFRRG